MERQGVAGKALEKAGGYEDEIREEIQLNIGYGNLNREADAGYLPYSPKAAEMLQMSAQQADEYRTRTRWYGRYFVSAFVR